MADLLKRQGFKLARTIDAPIPGVNPDAKIYIYEREQSKDVLEFDTQQGGIKLTADWCDLRDFEAIIQKAKELGI